MGLECGQQLHYCESVIGAKLLHVHSASPFSQPLSTPFESRFFFWTDAKPSITDKGQNRSTARISDNNFESPFKAFSGFNQENLSNG
jgi:hypothetical protein